MRLFTTNIPQPTPTTRLVARFSPQRSHSFVRTRTGTGTKKAMRPLAIASAVLAAGSSVVVAAAQQQQQQPQTAQIYIQPLGVSSPASPAPLAEITYDLQGSSSSSSDNDDIGSTSAGGGIESSFGYAKVTAYEAPEIPPGSSLVRVGLYDPARAAWVGATSAAGAENFGKGYSPHFLVNVSPSGSGGGASQEGGEEKDGEVGEGGRLLGASVKGVRIDAGQTRDFGPQARLVVASRGKQPELNRPVVLSPEGKKVEKEEKTFLQKFVFPSPSSSSSSSSTTFEGMCVLLANFGPLHTQVLVDDWYRIIACYGRRRRGQIELHGMLMQMQNGGKSALR